MKRLDINDPQVFNKWRELYDDLTNEEQRDFANECEERFPTQTHFTKSNFETLFAGRKNVSVLEVGGWKGELAEHCISNYDIKYWRNIEFCTEAVRKGFKNSDKYIAVCPNEFDWFLQLEMNLGLLYDVFVCTHTIEHLSDDHLMALLSHVSHIPTILLEAPITDDGEDFHDYFGTHKLASGWNWITGLMIARGYTCTKINDRCRIFQRIE